MSRKISPIGKNIKKLRKQRGLSQDRLSKLADISYKVIKNYDQRTKIL